MQFRPHFPRSVQDVVWLVAVVAAAVFVALYAYQAVVRLRYPYELEWLESGVIGHVQRIVDGHGLYGAPSRNWVPFLYTPLYDYVAAIPALIFGVHFWVLRAISIAASVGLGYVIYVIVHKETQHRAAAVTAVGVYAACYPLTDNWYDLARVDSLFLLLTTAGLLALRFGTTRRAVALAGLLMAAAALTKQTGLVISFPLGIYLAGSKRVRDSAIYYAALLVPFGLTCAALQATSGGWFKFWAFELAGEHEYQDGSFSNFFVTDIKPLWPSILLTVVVLITMLWKSELRWAGGYWAVVTLCTTVASLTSRMHAGGAENVLWPLFAVLAIDFGIGAGLLMRNGAALRALALAAVVAQLVGLAYSPSTAIPSAADRAAGDRFIETLRNYNGNVLVLSHPQYAVMAGGALQAGEGQVIDVLRAKNQRAKDLLRASFADAVHQRAYRAIYLDTELDAWVLPADFTNFYQQQSLEGYWPADAFVPVDTLPIRPTILYVPKRAA